MDVRDKFKYFYSYKVLSDEDSTKFEGSYHKDNYKGKMPEAQDLMMDKCSVNEIN